MEMTRRNRRAAIALAVIAAAAAGALLWAQPRSGATRVQAEGSLSIEGLKKFPFAVKQYAKLADLVVIGTPVSEKVYPFTENPLIPESAKNDEMYATAGYYDVTVRVSEYLKGKGPEQLSVRRLAPPTGVGLEGEAPTPTIDQTYVFFLSEGTELWTGGYLPLGFESLGVVTDQIVNFPSEQSTVEKVREDVKNAEKQKGEKSP